MSGGRGGACLAGACTSRLFHTRSPLLPAHVNPCRLLLPPNRQRAHSASSAAAAIVAAGRLALNSQGGAASAGPSRPDSAGGAGGTDEEGGGTTAVDAVRNRRNTDVSVWSDDEDGLLVGPGEDSSFLVLPPGSFRLGAGTGSGRWGRRSSSTAGALGIVTSAGGSGTLSREASRGGLGTGASSTGLGLSLGMRVGREDEKAQDVRLGGLAFEVGPMGVVCGCGVLRV